MSDVYLNKERYSHADVNIGMLGRTVVGVTELNYGDDSPVTDQYVVGNREPAGYVRNNSKYSGDITLFQDEFFGLVAAASGNWKKVPPFDITVTYVKSGLIIKETLRGVMFTGAPRQVSATNGDGLMVKMPIRIGSIVTI
jgi:hypothetical protein